MGQLTDQMTRLHGEVVASRHERETLMRDLAWGRKDRRTTVSEMQSDFSAARAEMARKMKKNLRAFITNLKRAVGGQRQEFRADLASARRAWLGMRTSRAAR